MKASGSDTHLDRAIKFYAFEKEHDLFAFTHSGFSLWRVMRNMVFQMHQGNAPTLGNVPRPKRVFIAIAAIAKLILVLALPPKVDWVIKGCVSALRWRVENRWLDPAIDPLLGKDHTAFKIIEKNSSFFEFQSKHAAYPAGLEPSAFTFLGRLFSTLLPINAGAFYRRVSNQLQKELHLHVAPSVLRLRVSTVIWQARLYRIFLKRTNPVCVIVTDTGEFGLRLACSQLAIPFCEIQHGVFDAFHPDAIPDGATGSDQELLIPDILFVKGQFWKDQLIGYRNGHVAVPVGNAIIDHWRKIGRGTASNPKAHIVVTTQGLAVTQFIDYIHTLIAVAPERLDWRMSIKLHPVYDDIECYQSSFMTDDRITIISGSDDPNIYELLSDSDLHISISSACHFDALALGIPSFMIPLPTHENLLYAVGVGNITLIASPNDVWAALEADDREIDRNYFCQPDYEKNTLKYFRRPRPIYATSQ